MPYSAGAAFVQVLPSLRGFARTITRELRGTKATYQLKVEADKKSLAEAEADVKKLTDRITGMRDKEADAAGRVRVAEVKLTELRTIATTKASVLAGAEERLGTSRRQLQVITSQLAARQHDLAVAQDRVTKTQQSLDRSTTLAAGGFAGFAARTKAAISNIKATLTDLDRLRVNPTVDVDTGRARIGVGLLQRQLRSLDRSRTDVPIATGNLTRALTLIGLITAAVAGLGAIAPGAVAALAAIPAAIGIVGQGVVALFAGFSGIGAAVKALGDADQEAAAKATQAARAREAAAERVRSAQQALDRVQQAVDRNAVTGAEQVRSARQALADAQVSAARQVAGAERALIQAQTDARIAQEDLTRARRDAHEALEDLDLALRDASLSEEEAVLRLEEATAELTDAREVGADDATLRKLDLAARRAALGLDQARERMGDLTEESDEWARTGVEGSAGVLAAHEQMAATQESVASAAAALREAEVAGIREVADARRALALTEQQVAWSTADAQLAVIEAQHDLTRAIRDTGAASTDIDKVAVAMTGLSPAGQLFARFIHGQVLPGLRGIRTGVQEALLPRIQNAMTRLAVLGPTVKAGLIGTALAIGAVADRGAQMMASGPWQADLATIMTGNTAAIGNFGAAGFALLDVFRLLTIAALPLLERFSAFTARAFETWAAWLEGKRATGELAAWFQRAFDTLAMLGSWVVTVSVGLWRLLQVLAPVGAALFAIVGETVRWIGAFAQAHPELTRFIVTVALAAVGVLWLGKTVFGLVSVVKTAWVGLVLLGKGLALLGLGAVKIGILAIRGAVLLWTAAQWLLNVAILANPLTWWILAIAAVIAIIVLAWKHSETFRDIVTGAFRFVGDAIEWFRDLVTRVLLNVLIAAFRLWDNVVTAVRNSISQAMTAVGNRIQGVADNVIHPVLNGLRAGLDTLGRWFDNTVGFIGRMWERLRSILAIPVNFVIREIYNNGIKAAWDKIAGWVGLPGLPAINEIKFAGGGQVPGTGDKDDVPALLTPGEWVIRKKIAQPVSGFLAALNAGQTEALQAAGGRYGRYAHFAAGGPVEKGLDFARRQHGKPYIWGGVGPKGFDCSGFMSAIANVLMERNPHSRIGTTASAPWSGWASGLDSAFGVGFFKGDPGHMAGTLAGANVESGGSPSMVKFVTNAAGARHSQFRAHMSLPQSGGKFVGGDGGGGGFNPISWLKGLFAPARRLIDSIVERFGRSEVIEGIKRIPGTLIDKIIEWAKNKVSGIFGGGDDGTGPIKDQVRGIAQGYGWDVNPQWASIDALVEKESSWNPNAANPKSSARGLFGKMTSLHGPIESTAAGQAEWGLPYIEGRYGLPSRAWAFHKAHNYYDDGGWLMPGLNVAINRTRRPEAVLTADQSAALIRTADQDGSSGVVYVQPRENHSEAAIAEMVARRQRFALRTGASV
ncbi:MAG: NlpC/P60 family protein [Pseudonocardiales bacterium]